MEKLEVKKGIQLTVTNLCMSKGQYYPEDEWSIDIIGSDVEKLIQKFWEEKYVSSGIIIDRVYFSKVEYVTYKDKNIILIEDDIDDNLYKLRHNMFHNTDSKEKALTEKKRLKEEAEEKEHQKYLKEKEERELKKLAELKAKYPDS